MSAQAEEVVASADKLNDMSQALMKVVGAFKLGDDLTAGRTGASESASEVRSKSVYSNGAKRDDEELAMTY